MLIPDPKKKRRKQMAAFAQQISFPRPNPGEGKPSYEGKSAIRPTAINGK
jgi:hypothetical protein